MPKGGTKGSDCELMHSFLLLSLFSFFFGLSCQIEQCFHRETGQWPAKGEEEESESGHIQYSKAATGRAIYPGHFRNIRTEERERER